MIVVPTLPERDQSHEEVVAAVVFSSEAALTKNVRERIHRERAVIEHHGADEEAANQHLPSGRA